MHCHGTGKRCPIFKAIQQDEALKAKFKAITDPESFIKIAENRGYNFTLKELETEIGKLSPEQMAAVINPYIT